LKIRLQVGVKKNAFSSVEGESHGTETSAAERGDLGVQVHREIRRLRRLLGLPPADPSPEMVEQRRQQVRERVRRFRERRR